MRISKLLVSLGLMIALRASAGTVAIIDSGVDYQHRDLAAKMWTNQFSSTTDGDGNVFEQDTHGWNFADNNNQIIDYQYLGTFSPDCNRFFDLQGKKLLGTATPAELDWLTQKREDEDFLKELGKFGNFIHGTHVSGITATGLVTSKIAGIKLIPTETPGQLVREAAAFAAAHPELGDEKAGLNFLATLFLKFAASRQSELLVKAGKYTAAIGAGVANGSFGTSVHAVQPIVDQMLVSLLGHEPSEQESLDYAKYFVGEIVKSAKAFPATAPNTLFVFAAGNDGTDNDELPSSPSNVKADNTIAVAASLGVDSLAEFSNTGATMVEVAAPGVVINSTIPGNAYMTLSGTSMAAPFVTSVAARVKEANPALTPAQIKNILVSTVDIKTWLRGKVSSSGVVNAGRAVQAATISRHMPIGDAIAQSVLGVADVESDNKSAALDSKDLFVLPLPSTL